MLQDILICPVCGGKMLLAERIWRCEKGHCFDVAKEGYVNLLRTNKSGDRIGDDKLSARCRRDFLNKDHYRILAERLAELLGEKSGRLLDICCGEGYYASFVAAHTQLEVCGFDIAREMVRLAAKRGRGDYFVANMAAIPVADESFDCAMHLFAPFHEPEFFRVLKPGGLLLSVTPGSRHLYGLKEALYDTPYLNEETPPVAEQLTYLKTEKLTGRILLESPEDIDAVFRMTPYYFHTSQRDKEKLRKFQKLESEVEFLLHFYQK